MQLTIEEFVASVARKATRATKATKQREGYLSQQVLDSTMIVVEVVAACFVVGRGNTLWHLTII